MYFMDLKFWRRSNDDDRQPSEWNIPCSACIGHFISEIGVLGVDIQLSDISSIPSRLIVDAPGCRHLSRLPLGMKGTRAGG